MTATTPSAPAKPPSTLLLLVRHGQTPTTGTVLPGLAPGLHLSDGGRVQAQRVAERLAALPIDGIYSSPLERACETAEATAASTGLKVNEHAGMIECDFGAWTGAALTELARLPQWQTVQHTPSAFRFPEGESFAQMQARMVGTLEAYFARGANLTRAAGDLHVHVNTVTQRLERVTRLLGPEWTEPERQLEVQLALRLHRLVGWPSLAGRPGRAPVRCPWPGGTRASSPSGRRDAPATEASSAGWCPTGRGGTAARPR